jgi:hypothetical protein
MIDLELPYGQGGRGDDIALKAAPMFGRTKSMQRWHIPRAGVLHDHTRVSYSVWCSATYLDPTSSKRPALLVDEITDDLPVCGTCVGRAQGAGHAVPVVAVTHEAGIVFEPRHIRRPRTCPGAKTSEWHPVNFRVGRCKVCDEYMPIRARGGPYDSHTALAAHEPGPGLVNPCPFHAWDRITLEGICSCGSDSVVMAS